MTVIFGKLLVSLLFGLLCFISLAFRQKLEYLLSLKKNTVYLAWLLFRLLPFIIIYILLDYQPQSDVVFFFDTSSVALKGGIVYKDFWQPYSPLFPYLNAIPLLIWKSGKAILLWMLLYELIAILLVRKLTGAGAKKDFFILLYLLLPAPLVFSVFGGQEDIFMWLFVSCAMLQYRSNGNLFKCGLWLGLGIITTKILLIIPVVLLLILNKKRRDLLLGLAIIGVPSAIVMYLLAGQDMLAPLKIGSYPFAPNLVSLMSPLVGGISTDNALLNWGGLAAVMAGTLAVIYPFRKVLNFDGLLLFVFLVCHLLMIILHKNSLPNYYYIILLPLVCFYGSAFSFTDWAVLIVLNIIAAIHPSLWYSLGVGFYGGFKGFTSLMWTDYGLQWIYILLSVYLVFRTTRPVYGLIRQQEK